MKRMKEKKEEEEKKERERERTGAFLPSNPAWVIRKAVSLRHLASPLYCCCCCCCCCCWPSWFFLLDLIFSHRLALEEKRKDETLCRQLLTVRPFVAAAAIIFKEKTVENRRGRRSLNRIRHCWAGSAAAALCDEWLCLYNVHTPLWIA